MYKNIQKQHKHIPKIKNLAPTEDCWLTSLALYNCDKLLFSCLEHWVQNKTSDTKWVKSAATLTCSFPVHPFSAPENITKPCGFLMFSGGRERVHWKQMGSLCDAFRGCVFGAKRYKVKVRNKLQIYNFFQRSGQLQLLR